jgi:outer membrane receptor for ferrienterochelin and colicins
MKFQRLSASAFALATIATPALAADQTGVASNTDIIVTAQKLDAARESIKPSLGASTYTLTSANIQSLPGSDNQPINDIILQLPGVSEDQFGQFHVRDEHNGVQYRLNGVILPESIAVFGQTLSPRLIDRMDLVTGTLPAQYGLRTAGIIDITTKTGLKDSATFSLYGGSHGTFEPSVSLSGSSGATSWFFSGDYKHSNLGIENVNGNVSAIHDQTDQFSGFGYIDHILSANDRIAFTGGYSSQWYQIPNPTGLVGAQTDYLGNPVAVNGVTQYPSEQLNETQLLRTGFGSLSWLHSAGPFSFQASLYARTSSLDYRPDYVGELLFNGMAQAASKKDFTVGGQIDGVYKLNDHHTLRGGVIISRDHSTSSTQTSVYPTTGDVYDPTQPLLGYQQGAINGPPETLPFSIAATQTTYSVYLQDEWHIVDNLILNYGARFDENDGPRNERQLSPRVNLVWKPNPSLTLHTGYARYFAPAPFELITNANLAQVENTFSAPNVRTNDATYAQRENYFDLGFQQKIGKSFTLGLDGYYRRDTNLVDEGQFGAPIILTPFNYAKGRLFGTELSLTYAKGGFSAYANLAYQKAQGTNIVSNQYNFSAVELAYINTHYIYLDHDQTWTGSGGVAYRWRNGALKDTRVSADLVYGSGLRTDGDMLPAPYNMGVPNGAALAGHAVINASIGHKFESAGLDVRVDVQNLLDNVYEIRDGQGVGVGAPSYGARRGVFLGISKSF